MKNRALNSTLSIVIAFLLTFSCFAAPVPAGSVTDTNETENTASDSFSQPELSGSGTETDPYIIDSPLAFLKAASLINDNGNKNTYGKAVYSITACLNFDGIDLVPWGTSGAPFNGVLYGNGHKLYNIALVDTAHFGIVGYMENGKIDGVHAQYKDAEYSVTEMTNFGGIAAIVIPSATTPNAYITQCSVKGDITIDSNMEIEVGGIYSKSAKEGDSEIYVRDCVSYMNLDLTADGVVYAGLVVAHAECSSGNPFSFSRCVTYGDISVTARSGKIGGIAGVANGEEQSWSDWVSFGALEAEINHLENCVTLSDVTVNVAGGDSFAGIIVGHDGNNTTVFYNCAYSSAVVLTSNCGAGNVHGDSHTEANLKDASYMASKFGFDFTNTWTMGEDGVMTLKNSCSDCVTAPYILLTDSTVTVNGFKGELAVSVFSGLVLEKIVFVPVTSYSSLSYGELGLAVDKGDTVKAFLFEEKSTLKPITQSQTFVAE